MKAINQADKISVYFQVTYEREIDTIERGKTGLQDILNYHRTSIYNQNSFRYYLNK